MVGRYVVVILPRRRMILVSEAASAPRLSLAGGHVGRYDARYKLADIDAVWSLCK